MDELEVLQAGFLILLVTAAASVVITSLHLSRRTGPVLKRRPLLRPTRDPASGPGYRQMAGSASRPGGQILEYLGKLAQDFEAIATDEEIATPRGAVAIPMAIAVRGEVRVLYPVELPLSAERIEETLRRVALIRRHRYPEARIAFLSERPLPLELVLAASPDNALGRLVAQTVLHVTELREGRDDATVFREVFRECTGEELAYAVADVEKIDRFLLHGEPIGSPITPGLRRLGNLLGKYLEWVLVGLFADRVRRDGGKLALRLEGGDLDLDPGNLALEALYSAGRVSLAGLVRDLEQLAKDPFHIPREVSPALLQRLPTPGERARHHRPPQAEEALLELRDRRLHILGAALDAEELSTLHVCSCGKSRLHHQPLHDGPPCRSLSEMEARLMDAMQRVAATETRCAQCQRVLAARDLKLVAACHPLADCGIDLWMTLDRLPSGKFWWHLARLRRGGDVTPYANVLTPSTFRRAFGRFFSVKEAWGILFQRVASSVRPERLRAEPGLHLHAAPEGSLERPPTSRRLGFFDPAFVVVLPRDEGPGASFLAEERELRALGVFGRAPVAWVVARARPFRRAFEQELKRLGATASHRGLEYTVRSAEGGEAFRDLAEAITQACLRAADYLGTARVLAREATEEAAGARRYLVRARDVLGSQAALRYLPAQGILEATPEGASVPSRIALRTLMSKTAVEDGSFDRYLKMALSQADLGVGLEVCGCGARAFVSKKVKPRDWPGGSEQRTSLARRSQGPVSLIFTRDCREHSHYLTMAELERLGIGLPDLERRFERDLAENGWSLSFRAIRVDAHVFFAAAGFNAASIVLAGAHVRGLFDAAEIEPEAPSYRYLATTSGSFVLGDPEAPAAAYREAAKVADGLLRNMGEPFEPLLFEGLVSLPRKGCGEFRIGS